MTSHAFLKTMTKFVIITVVVVTAISTLLFLLGNFKMFEVTEDTLASHPVPGKDFTIAINRVAAGATTADVIHVKKVYSDGKSEVLKVMEDNGDPASSELIADSVLRIIVIDAGHERSKRDTIEVAFR